VSDRRRKQQLSIKSRLDEESMTLDSLRAAERLFAELAVRMLLHGACEDESGRAAAPPSRREGAHPLGERPGPIQRERTHERRELSERK